MNENDVQSFGNAHPCGDHIAGGLHGESADDYDRSFTAYDTRRYGQESHLPACLDEIDWRGLKVPESGLGQGSESKHLIRRGASWSGPDLTHEPVDRVRARLAIRASPHDDLQRGSVLAIPWPDDTFDLVFSHGVLHHVPKTQAAQREIHRVLKPGGGLVAMLYARGSLNYQLSIKAVCRVMLAAAYPLRRSRFLPEAPMLRQHLTNAETQCLRRYLAIDNVTHRNSDGPLYPYARAYSLRQVAPDFPDFELVRSYSRYMPTPPLPARRLCAGTGVSAVPCTREPRRSPAIGGLDRTAASVRASDDGPRLTAPSGGIALWAIWRSLICGYKVSRG